MSETSHSVPSLLPHCSHHLAVVLVASSSQFFHLSSLSLDWLQCFLQFSLFSPYLSVFNFCFLKNYLNSLPPPPFCLSLPTFPCFLFWQWHMEGAVFFKKCEGCDSVTLHRWAQFVLHCLSKGHCVDSCCHCMKFTIQAWKNRAAWLATFLLHSSLRPDMAHTAQSSSEPPPLQMHMEFLLQQQPRRLPPLVPKSTNAPQDPQIWRHQSWHWNPWDQPPPLLLLHQFCLWWLQGLLLAHHEIDPYRLSIDLRNPGHLHQGSQHQPLHCQVSSPLHLSNVSRWHRYQQLCINPERENTLIWHWPCQIPRALIHGTKRPRWQKISWYHHQRTSSHMTIWLGKLPLNWASHTRNWRHQWRMLSLTLCNEMSRQE